MRKFSRKFTKRGGGLPYFLAKGEGGSTLVSQKSAFLKGGCSNFVILIQELAYNEQFMSIAYFNIMYSHSQIGAKQSVPRKL